MTIKVLSLFDGISGARQALKELDIDCEYYASEIDKWAIQIAKSQHPDIIHIGDVKDVGFIIFKYSDKCTILDDIDILIGGSPCQDLSIANKERKGLQGDRSGLFYEYLRILNEVKPKYFVLENVASMSKAAKATITEELFGIEPVMINSALVTAQQRKRLYWVGKLVDGKYEQVKIEQPEDQGIYLKDIIEKGVVDRDKSYCIDANYFKGGNLKSYFEKCRRQLVFKANNGKRVEVDLSKDFYSFKEVRTEEGKLKRAEFRKLTGLDSTKRGAGDKKFIPKNDRKANCLTTGLGIEGVIKIEDIVRKLTPTECCRLQGFPDDYVSMVSKTQGYKALGNGFTVPVIKHILKNILT
jgi:DNA-cytosine methyltransferase